LLHFLHFTSIISNQITPINPIGPNYPWVAILSMTYCYINI
jgi:hypothetical protein